MAGGTRTACLGFLVPLPGFKISNFCIQLLAYLLTPWCRVLLETLTGLQLVKKFPAFHGTRRFITALTSVRHLSLSWASPIQSTYTHHTSWRSILILSTHLCLCLPSDLLPSGFYLLGCLYCCMYHVPYRNCIYNPLPEGEPSGTKHV